MTQNFIEHANAVNHMLAITKLSILHIVGCASLRFIVSIGLLAERWKLGKNLHVEPRPTSSL